MSRRTPALLAALSLAATGVLVGGALPTQAAPAGFRQAQPTTAPGGPGTKTVWTEADKAGFGTARARGSNVWFTLQQGRISEVFYPDLSTPEHPQPRAGRHRRAHLHRPRVDRHAARRRAARRPQPAASRRSTPTRAAATGSPRRIVTDPRRDASCCGCGWRRSTGRQYQLYALHDPALGNDGEDDRARTVGRRAGRATTAPLAQRAGVAARRSTATSNGFVGTAATAGRDLEDDHRLDHDATPSAGPGNVVQTGRVAGVTGTRRATAPRR